MLSNPLGVTQGAYFTMPIISPSCNPCSPAQQAFKDLWQWQHELQHTLISGEGEVKAYNNGLQIIIRWQPLENLADEVEEWVLYG